MLAFTTQALFWDFEQSRSGGIGIGLPIVALWTKLRDFKLPNLFYVHNNELTMKKKNQFMFDLHTNHPTFNENRTTICSNRNKLLPNLKLRQPFLNQRSVL